MSWAKPSCPDWMDGATYDQLPDQIAVRELRVRVEQAGFRVDELVLITTLLDATAYTKEEVADLYFRRWNIELDLRSIKVDMRMDVLRCMSPEMVEKEIWAHLLAYNVVRSVMADAAREHGEEPRRLSFKGAMRRCGRSRSRSGWRDGRGGRSWSRRGCGRSPRIGWEIGPGGPSPGRRNADPSRTGC